MALMNGLNVPEQPCLPLGDLPLWVEVKDGNDTARSLFDRHYTRHRYSDGRKPLLFVGPGEKMVLISPDAMAVFAWRKFRSDNGQIGVNCAIFRNESAIKSSDLIRAACVLAWERWPGERLYTYVNSRKIRKKRDPGRCFRRAGWIPCGVTKVHGLLILECLPTPTPLGSSDSDAAA